jgi:acyl-CoA thioester hydrolase
MSDLSFLTEIDVRFRDLDPAGHVNNAVYMTYCEQARVDFFEDVVGVGSADLNLVIAHQSIDYRQPIEGTGTVEVAVGVPSVGDTSFEMTYELTYEGDVVATGESVQVVVDTETKQATPIPDAWRDRILEASTPGEA